MGPNMHPNMEAEQKSVQQISFFAELKQVQYPNENRECHMVETIVYVHWLCCSVDEMSA